MKKLRNFMIGGELLIMLIKFFKMTMITLGVLAILMFIRGRIIRRIPQKDPSLKWGGN